MKQKITMMFCGNNNSNHSNETGLLKSRIDPPTFVQLN